MPQVACKASRRRSKGALSEVQVKGPGAVAGAEERPALACGGFWAVTGYVAAPCCTYGPAANADTDTSKTPFLELTLLFDIQY